MEKTLKFKFDMNCKFSVYVPSTTNIKEQTDNSKFVLYTLKRMIELFGGATTTPAKGGWACNDGSLVIEDVNIVYSFCSSEQAKKNFNEVVSICEFLKNEMKQEAVTLEYNGQIKFI